MGYDFCFCLEDVIVGPKAVCRNYFLISTDATTKLDVNVRLVPGSPLHPLFDDRSVDGGLLNETQHVGDDRVNSSAAAL